MKKFLALIAVVALLSTVLCGSFVSASESPTNMLPADLCSNYEKASAFLNGITEEDVNYNGMDGVLHIPVIDNADGWVYSLEKVPYEEYTVYMDIAIIDGSANFLFGVGENGSTPWTQLIFEPSFDDGILKFFNSKHLGNAWDFPGNQKTGFIDMVFDGETFYNLTVEVTAEGMFVTFDDLVVGDILSSENYVGDLSYIGFRASGNSSGYLIKNLGIYEGTGLSIDPESAATQAPTVAPTAEPTEEATVEPTVEATEEATEEATAEATEAATAAPTEAPEKDGGNGWILPVVIIAVVVIAGAAVVFFVLKKKK